MTADIHPDDAAIDRFSVAMKIKMARSRAKGRQGWADKEACSDDYLARMLVGHLPKGNPGNFEDLAIIAMMLHQRGADPAILAASAFEPVNEALLLARDRIAGRRNAHSPGPLFAAFNEALGDVEDVRFSLGPARSGRGLG